MPTPTPNATVRRLLADVGAFSRAVWPDRALRLYQLPAARAIVRAALWSKGGAGEARGATLVVAFARQSGKDELLAQAVAFILIRRQRRGGEIVIAAPSLVPQGQLTRERIEARLREAAPFAPDVTTEGGAIVRVGRASVRFLSAGPGAKVRGATASLLLVANEAQDIPPDRWDAAFDPMGASTNAPTVFCGTVWTRNTLLAREMTAIESSEQRATSGEQTPDTDARGSPPARCFRADWRVVARDVPAYGERVRARIARLGADHPFVRTEYCLEPLDGAGTFLDATRQAQMRGDHPRQHSATPGSRYALLLDVAGEKSTEYRGSSIEEDTERESRRDSTALTVVEIVSPPHAAYRPEGTRTHHATLPIYRVVNRRLWTGANHLDLAAEVADLARRVWAGPRGSPAHVIVDATGIGHGLAAMLRAALPPGGVTPFVFTAASKSDLGWRWLAAVAAGRYREYVPDDAPDTRAFWAQVRGCTFAVRPGVGQQIAWSVPDPALHDDLLISAALAALLDDTDWQPRVAVGRIAAP